MKQRADTRKAFESYLDGIGLSSVSYTHLRAHET